MIMINPTCSRFSSVGHRWSIRLALQDFSSSLLLLWFAIEISVEQWGIRQSLARKMLQRSAEKSSLQQALAVEHILAVLNLFILWLSVPPYNCLALNCKLGSQFVLSSQVPSKTVIFACLDSSCQSLLIKNCLLILNKMSDIWRSNGQPGLDCQCHSFNKAILLKLGA